MAFGRVQWTVVATATANTATATKTGIAVLSPKPAQRHVVTGFSLSVDRVVSTAANLLIKNGSTTIFSHWIPVGFYGPLEVQLNRPYACAQGADAVAVCATLGTGVVCVVVLQGMTVSD
jgi:hypothetical protein